MKTTSHSEGALIWVDEQMKTLGVDDYHFCPENDCYVCDRYGNFYSICHRQYSKAGNLVEKYRIMKLNGSIDKYGYVTYRITIDGIKKHLKAHRMMLNAWIGERQNLVVNHKDGNKQNNALSNLEWCTVAENNAHAISTGLFDPHVAKHELAIPLADWLTLYILYEHFGMSMCELGRINNVSHSTISKIVQRIRTILPEEVQHGT